MPFRLQTSSDPNNPNWKNPAAISIYDNGWKTTKVCYVYDMGWKVVYPDPIIPSYTSLTYGWTRDPPEPAEIDIGFRTTNVVDAVVYLYNSSTPSGTPIQTAVLTPFTVVGDTTIWDHIFFVSNQGTYSTRVVLTSITENTTTFDPGPLVISYPTVSVTSAGTTDNNDFFVTWSATNQGTARVTIEKTSDSSYVDSFLITNGNQRSFSTNTSGSLMNPFLANTQYTVYVWVTDPLYEGSEIGSRNFTSVNNPPAVVDITSTSSTCNSITVNWTNSNVSSGTIVLSRVIGIEQGMFIYDSYLTYNFTPPTTSYTFTGLLPRLLSSATQGYYRIESRGVNILGQQGISDFVDTETLFPSVNPPTDFTATSGFYGNTATLSWTAAVGNCTSVTGYNVQYKLSSSGTWLTLVNGITATSVDTGLYVTLTPGTSYDFRVRANGSGGIVSGYATTTITTNNTIWLVSLTPPTDTIITTFSSLVLTAQLKNIAGNNIPQSGVTINWSLATLQGTSLAQSSTTTNSSGQATNTLNTGAFNGRANVLAQGPSGTGVGESSIIVTLTNALNPSLSSTRTNFGYDVTHSNYNSSWSYSGIVDNGGFNFDGVWGDGFYTIVIPPLNTAVPVASRNALVSVTCTSGTWTAQPSAKTRVTSTRPGYFAGIGEVTNSPTGTLSFSYTWYYGNGEFLGTGQTRNITSAMRGRNVYCIVIATRTGGIQGFQAQSNSISIPA